MTARGGRVEGDVRLSGTVGKMPCVTAMIFGCFFICVISFSLPLSPCVRLTAGMNMSPVSRLKKTWSKVKTAKFDILEVSPPDRDSLFLSTTYGFCYLIIQRSKA